MNMAKRTLILVLLAATALGAQADPAEKTRLARFKGVFIYNFIEFVKWPEARNSGDFVIGVVGESDVTPILEQIAPKRKVGDREIAVRRHAVTDDLSSCHILFLAPSVDEKLEELVASLADKHVLTVSDAPNFTQRGVAINFVLVDGKLKFEIASQALARAGLVASSQLLKLGIPVK